MTQPSRGILLCLLLSIANCKSPTSAPEDPEQPHTPPNLSSPTTASSPGPLGPSTPIPTETPAFSSKTNSKPTPKHNEISPSPISNKSKQRAFDGPQARGVDSPRDDIIDQVMPHARACYRSTGEKGRGRLRVVVRLKKDGNVKTIDITPSGTLDPKLASCTEKKVAKQRFHVTKDSPRFLSFPIVLPERP